jgi:hypothetical protein
MAVGEEDAEAGMRDNQNPDLRTIMVAVQNN